VPLKGIAVLLCSWLSSLGRVAAWQGGVFYMSIGDKLSERTGHGW